MPLDVSKAPAAASPLWVIALFIALSEATAGVAAVITNGTARLIFTCFAVVFPAIVFVVFVWLLIRHAPKLYAPGQYSQEITPESYRVGISQANSKVFARAVAKAVVPELGKNFEQTNAETIDQVARRFEEAVDESSVFVSIMPPLTPRGEVLQIPVTKDTTVRWLLDAIYWSIQPRVKPFTYGRAWMLYEEEGAFSFDKIGARWAEMRNLEDDTRPIVEVGIKPGSRLTAAKISNGRKTYDRLDISQSKITFRHGITEGRTDVAVVENETIKEAAARTGLIVDGSSFNVRDKADRIVDNDLAIKHVNEVLSLDVTI